MRVVSFLLLLSLLLPLLLATFVALGAFSVPLAAQRTAQLKAGRAAQPAAFAMGAKEPSQATASEEGGGRYAPTVGTIAKAGICCALPCLPQVQLAEHQEEAAVVQKHLAAPWYIA